MTFKTGLIGTGFIADSHASGYEQAEAIELTAASDIDEEELLEFGENWSIPESARYNDHQQMIEAAELDALSVTSPSFLHYDHVIEAVNATNSPRVIWCEKPIALNVADAREMVSVCREANVELVVNHTRRFADSYVALRRALEDGLLGDIHSVTVQFPRELLRNGTHTVDLIEYLFGTSGATVTGQLTGEHGMGDHVEREAPDGYDDCGGCGTIKLTDGTFVTIDHTAPRRAAPNTLQLVGSRGQLRIREDGPWSYRQIVEADTPYGTEIVETSLPDALSQEDRDMFDVGASHIVELLDGDTKNRSPGHEAVNVLELIIAMFISHYTGSRITLPLASPLRGVEVFSW